MTKELSKGFKGFTGIEINGVRFSNIQEMLIYMDKQRNHIIELEKENAELKEELKNNEDFATVAYMQGADNQKKKAQKQLTRAKEFLNEFMRISKASDEDFEHDFSELIRDTEQFLNGETIILEDVQGGNSPFDADEVFNKEMKCKIQNLEKENKRLQHELAFTRGQKGICLEIDGKDMTDVYYLQQQLNEKDIIISFLKKELAHKMSYRQVMKRQYRELKQQMKSDNERHSKVYAELVAENAKLRHFDGHLKFIKHCT